MAIKMADKAATNKGITATQQIMDSDDMDFDNFDDLVPKNKASQLSPPTDTLSFQAASLAESVNHPCYGNLVNPPSSDSHWHAQQVQAELKVVLRGFSSRNRMWSEERANSLILKPCGLSEDGYTLLWELEPSEFDSYLMLDDIRSHLKYAFGEHFIVRPVSELSSDARGWKFNLRA